MFLTIGDRLSDNTMAESYRATLAIDSEGLSLSKSFCVTDETGSFLGVNLLRKKEVIGTIYISYGQSSDGLLKLYGPADVTLKLSHDEACLLIREIKDNLEASNEANN